MKESTGKPSVTGGAERCDYLGLRDDPQTALAFPSPWNCCYRARPVAPVRLEYQRVFCQTAAHAACAMLLQEKPSALPADLRGRGSPFRPRGRSGGLGVAFLLLSAVALGAILWRAAGGVRVPAPNWSTVGEWYRLLPFVRATEASLSPTPAVPVAAVDIPMQPPAVVLPTPSPAATLRRPPQEHDLEIPIHVGDGTFLIHRVMGGETFEKLTKNYDTTAEAIRGLNPGLTGSLWADTVIVIAPGMKAVDPRLPVLEPYQVQDPSIKIDDLATALGIAPAPLRAYNGCDDDCRLLEGDWILVPRSE